MRQNLRLTSVGSRHIISTECAIFVIKVNVIRFPRDSIVFVFHHTRFIIYKRHILFIPREAEHLWDTMHY